MWFRRKEEPDLFSYSDYYREQVARIRRGEPIVWLPGTPISIRQRSKEIDRLNAKLDKKTPH